MADARFYISVLYVNIRDQNNSGLLVAELIIF